MIKLTDTLIAKMKSAKAVAVLTGAGISAESGVPTFRGTQGLWKKYRPEHLANFDAFIKNPELVWEWYKYRQNIIRSVQPNPGHHALVTIEKNYPDFSLITQNVDNLHRRAGNRKIYELHGNIMRSRCVDCNRYFEDSELDAKDTKVPRCPCGGMIRPDVVWFGEMLPQQALLSSINASNNCDVFLTIGTSALVHPAASLPIEAQRSGAFLIEINYEPTVISHLVNESIIGKSGEILPELIQRLGLS